MSISKNQEAQWRPSVLNNMFETDWLGGTTNTKPQGRNIPSVNILESDDNFVVAVAAPGKTKKDFNIELDNDVLTISSETNQEKESKEKNIRYTRKEFSYSSFKRAFSLPESIDSEKISASYNNGVLEITLPKREEAKVQPKRMIDIK